MVRIALLAFLVSSFARADVVTLTSGGHIEGIVEDEGSSYKITTTAGVTRMPKERVASVEQKDCVLSVYAREAVKVSENDAAGHFKLAQLCQEGKWTSKMREEAQKVIALDPDHAGARAMLGYVLYEGKWMTERERYEAMGFLEYKGKWYPARAVRKAQARDNWIASLRRGEDALNLSLAHLAAPDPGTRKHGAQEFIDAGHQYGVLNPEKAAQKFLAYYDDQWKRYIANDVTYGTLELRATDAHMDALDGIDVALSQTPTTTIVHIETPKVHVTEVRTTVQVPLALHVTLVNADLAKQQGAPPDESMLLGGD